MKKLIIIGAIGVLILIIGLVFWRATGTRSGTSNGLVTYAVADTSHSTNMIFTITEIWAGAKQGSAVGITKGTQIRYQYPNGSTAYLPDAAIVTFSKDFSPSDPQAITFGPGMGMSFVRHGEVQDMTVQEFKRKMGL
jgi:hypothetical protein